MPNKELIEKCRLPEDKRNLHWEWVDDGDGYNQRDDWNIKTLLDAQLTHAIPIIAQEIENMKLPEESISVQIHSNPHSRHKQTQLDLRKAILDLLGENT